QEPRSQELKVSVYDRDFFSAKELLTLNIGQTFGAKELMGRCLVKLAPLRCAYRSFDSFKREEPLTADTGIVIVRVITAEHLQRAPGRKNTAMTAYVRVKCGDDSASVPPLTSTANHTWTNANTLEFYDVKFSSNIKLKVMERALQDDSLGNLEVLVSDIADACDFNPLSGGREHGFMLRHFPLEDGGGARLTASLRFVPCC
ncbi:C2 domain-containing protein, partial [Haematococcus lacustris]